MSDIALRLHRGGSEFLAQATEAIRDIQPASVFSPALYPSNTRAWRKAGYEPFSDLEVMQRQLSAEIGPVPGGVVESPRDQIEQLIDIDRRAFEGFWRMSGPGIEEALLATPKASILVSTNDGEVTGYALVGTQLNVAFLQRVAVPPEHAGQGVGTALVRSSLLWGRQHGAQTMILNIKPDNDRARRLYERTGFALTGTALELLEYKG